MAGYYRDSDETDLNSMENGTNDNSAFEDIDSTNSIFDNGEDNDYLEEAAAETAPLDGMDRPDDQVRIDEDDRGGAFTDNGTGYGILALVLSIVAFFFLPVVMGAAGIIIGFIARSKGAGTWGGWAIGIGIAALAIRLFMAPFF